MKIWHEILETALQTPSPHNVQPWRVKIVDERRAKLYIDSRRTLPKEDTTGSFIILAMGMFIEALRTLAARKNFKLSERLLQPPEQIAPAILESKGDILIPFAELEIIPDETAAENFDEKLFFKRRTSRLHLRDEKLPVETFESLQKIAADRHQKFSTTTAPAQIERLMNFNTVALFEDLNAPDYHDEIVEWLRFTDKQSKARLDGLDYRSMNVSRLNLWLSARMPWLLRLPIARQILAKVYRSQSGVIPTLGFISGGFWKPSDAIEAGKFLLRFWLETAAHDVYIHPFGNLVTNRTAAKAVESETGIADIWLVFKIGFSDEPPKSRRLPVERILVN